MLESQVLLSERFPKTAENTGLDTLEMYPRPELAVGCDRWRLLRYWKVFSISHLLVQTDRAGEKVR